MSAHDDESEEFGGWRLESLVAVGGMGEVWNATRGGTTAAVKRLHTHLVRNDEAAAMFAIEQRLTTTLPRHPNLIHAHEAGVAGDARPYIALALAPGEDLRRILAPPVTPSTSIPPPPIMIPRARAIAIAIGACEAAAHLHAAGWVHGDINPGNLIVDDSDHVTLIDLGVVRALGAGGTVRGTHAYMAPEQVRGEAWTAATDVFAIGVVLWELIAGERLFHRGPVWLSMAAVIEVVPAAVPDPSLDAIVQAALVKDPALRTQTAGALAQQLRDLGN